MNEAPQKENNCLSCISLCTNILAYAAHLHKDAQDIFNVA